MSLPDSCAFAICGLFVLFVVSMIAIDKIAKFAYRISYVDRLDFGIVKMSVCDESVHERARLTVPKDCFDPSASLEVPST